MGIPEVMRGILDEKGIKQAWVAAKMNAINPYLEMTGAKLSAVICGTRRLTGDELLAFCQAIEESPDIFLPQDGINRTN